MFQNGADDVKKHRWFKNIDWDAVPLRKLKVTAVSALVCLLDISQFHFHFCNTYQRRLFIIHM